jgi:hypothetical protein
MHFNEWSSLFNLVFDEHTTTLVETEEVRELSNAQPWKKR